MRVPTQSPLEVPQDAQQVLDDYQILLHRLEYLTKKHHSLPLPSPLKQSPQPFPEPLDQLRQQQRQEHQRNPYASEPLAPYPDPSSHSSLTPVKRRVSPHHIHQTNLGEGGSTSVEALDDVSISSHKYNEQMKVTITNMNSLVEKLDRLAPSMTPIQVEKYKKIKNLKLNGYKKLSDGESVYHDVFPDAQDLNDKVDKRGHGYGNGGDATVFTDRPGGGESGKPGGNSERPVASGTDTVNLSQGNNRSNTNKTNNKDNNNDCCCVM
ncbi:unnamed protein product [Ambrosiozyma monospora]|uniref:Unnamed protein product n=1 Tax=Ambrosiozyma monospora TaxID=43982 RepID=A0ACB5T1C9_AMBMO|nr:unnamed protein product [Ambrosiozyma monospora]